MHDHDAGNGPDSGAVTPPAKFELTQRELAGAVAAIASGRNSREEIRITMRPLCARARQEKMDAAELLKVVKHSFAASAGGPGPGSMTERQQMLDRIISVCIDEYYAAD
jgi:hypothetical protein